ncbi:5983_t:CDS:2 [Acaulospora morrowiae]|uniref:5983_t:CDS:1 n=1 Tax=Acaulospora morrowiae TaxID=94023 RepID=A0A9N9IDR8_9GLOM|nr:5983_t:CDS:2 [Acaulospora morrowiae]
MKRNPYTIKDPLSSTSTLSSTSNNTQLNNIAMSLSLALNALLISYSLLLIIYLLQPEGGLLITKHEKSVILLVTACVIGCLSGIPFVYQFSRKRLMIQIERTLPEELLSLTIFVFFFIETIIYINLTTKPQVTALRYFYVILFYIYHHLFDKQRSNPEKVGKSNNFIHLLSSLSMSPSNVDKSTSNNSKPTFSNIISSSVLRIIQSWLFKLKSPKAVRNILYTDEELENLLNDLANKQASSRRNKINRNKRQSDSGSEESRNQLSTIHEDEEEFDFDDDQTLLSSKEFECESTTKGDENRERRDSGYEETSSESDTQSPKSSRVTLNNKMTFFYRSMKDMENDEGGDSSHEKSLLSTEHSHDSLPNVGGEAIFFYRIMKSRKVQTLSIERSTIGCF